MLPRLTLAALLLIIPQTVSGQEDQPSGSVSQAEPIEPREKIVLFNGRDFTGLTCWLQKTGLEKPGKVYGVTDGLLHISGEGLGYVRTNDKYRNYHLSLEFRWGTQRTNVSKYVRNSGVLLHGSGMDGGSANGAWMASIEVQLAQGCEGDIIVIGGKDQRGERVETTVTGKMKRGADGRPRWNAAEGTETRYSGRQFWWSQHEEGFAELLDTRGRHDVASPYGEWTKVECVCWEKTITVKVNGQTVNQVYDVRPAAGHILLENEQYEIFFRSIELQPVAPQDRVRKQP